MSVLHRKMGQLFWVNSGLYNDLPFQTGLIYRNPATVKDRLIEMVEENALEDEFYLTLQFAHMIHAEKRFFRQHAVFYRTVGKQYAVYEIYSLLFAIFGRPQPAERLQAMRSRNRAALDFQTLCCNSILAADYAQSMESLIQNMDVAFGQPNDMHNAYIPLLSANCSLDDRDGSSKFAFNYTSNRDTDVFWQGYEAKSLLDHCISVLFQRVFQDASDTARDRIEAALHCDGHMIQIFVPMGLVDACAFPAVEYGYKVDAFEMRSGAMLSEISEVNDKTNTKKHIDKSKVARQVPFSELLRTKHLCRVQARIYGHPDIYLKHGAHCRVYHGSPTFDKLEFRHSLITILHPWLAALVERGFVMSGLL